MIPGWYTDMKDGWIEIEIQFPSGKQEKAVQLLRETEQLLHDVTTLRDKNILPGARVEGVKPEVRDANILPDARIGDADRTRYVTHINDLYANGYLTSEEHDARINLVFKTKTATELQFLIKDLPNFPAPVKIKPPFRRTGYASAMIIFLGIILILVSVVMGNTDWGLVPFLAGGLMIFAGFFHLASKT